jgi:ribose transport system substrate-binding protein
MKYPALLATAAILCGFCCVPTGFAQSGKKWVIALSNSYYGNTWRRQMVEAFKAAAEEAKKQGTIGDYIVENGDGTVNQQVSQLNELILKGVDAIAINAASQRR